MKIVLGSASARRKELLELLGYDFIVHPVEVDEHLYSYRNAEDFAYQVALKKGLATTILHPEDLIICADTIVVLEDNILGKPRDIPDARKMIGSLSGKIHHVITGVFLNYQDYQKVFTEKTQVRIDKMTADEVEAYINTKEPYDKSGGYAIQGIFGKHVKAIRGDFYNVMGLPINRVYREIKKIESKYKIIFPRK